MHALAAPRVIELDVGSLVSKGTMTGEDLEKLHDEGL
jgi:hypothetical protein